MITDNEKKTILDASRRYRVKRVVLFGSALSVTGEASDVDIAVEGVDLSRKTKFTDLILKEGITLHG